MTKTLIIIKIISNNKKFVFILGDSIVKNLNGFLIMTTNNNKHIVTTRPYTSMKVYCMYDHMKPTLRAVNLDNIILHVRTGDLNSAED